MEPSSLMVELSFCWGVTSILKAESRFLRAEILLLDVEPRFLVAEPCFLWEEPQLLVADSLFPGISERPPFNGVEVVLLGTFPSRSHCSSPFLIPL